VDRGRLRPTHRQWSWYLREVAGQAGAEIIAARVTGLEAAGGRWRLTVQPEDASRPADGTEPEDAGPGGEVLADGDAGPGGEVWADGDAGTGGEVWADGVVVTGAGPPIRVARQPEGHPRVLDGRSYWLAQGHGHLARNVCVIGSGETAASVVISLVSKLPKRSTIDVVTSRGVLYSRGESYAENRLYSDPADWPGLAESHRREFLERTDRGVFSQQAETTLNGSRGFRTLAGRAVGIQAGRQQVVVDIEYGTERERVAYDLVVVAIGFQARWFEGLLGEQARGLLASALGGAELERRIGPDLSVAGLSPPLHLPVVAGLAQGPGFPNLSCLGLLSDRILGRYVTAAERRERV
jgi:mycobactin lysine-N-oxygenase